MTDSVDTFATQLGQRFEGQLSNNFVSHGTVTLELNPEQILDICRVLRDEDEFLFEQLTDLCGVDYSYYGQADWETKDTTSSGFSRGVSQGIYKDDTTDNQPKFAVVYHLLSIKHNRRLRLRCRLDNEPPRINSVISIWASANWYEREAFDLFGILFDGHPDLRRILTDYGFIGHPFRKDFPLEGNVEVRYDTDKQRVIYQPVTIQNRVLVPRVIRDNNRYTGADDKEEVSDA